MHDNKIQSLSLSLSLSYALWYCESNLQISGTYPKSVKSSSNQIMPQTWSKLVVENFKVLSSVKNWPSLARTLSPLLCWNISHRLRYKQLNVHLNRGTTSVNFQYFQRHNSKNKITLMGDLHISYLHIWVHISIINTHNTVSYFT